MITFQDKYKNNIILLKSFEFAKKVVQYTEKLEEDRKYVIANQLLKSGTSIGANIKEAQNSESKADFIHKMKLALKELRETSINLRMLSKAKMYSDENLVGEARQLVAIFQKSIDTAQGGT